MIKRTNRIQRNLMFVIIFLVMTPLACAQVADTSWPMFQHDTRHTGLSAHAGNPSGGIAWTFDTGGAIYASPVLGSDDRIYIGNAAGKLYCLNRRGDVMWS